MNAPTTQIVITDTDNGDPARYAFEYAGRGLVYVDGPGGDGDSCSTVEIKGPDKDRIAEILLSALSTRNVADALQVRVASLESLVAEREAERDAVVVDLHVLSEQDMRIASERNALKAERDALVADRDDLRQRLTFAEAEINSLSEEVTR
jgi:chromosome segregation ATPase